MNELQSPNCPLNRPYKKLKLSPGVTRDEHRVIVERSLGRRLDRNEVVHHINGDRGDNRPENLQVMSLAEHSRLHALTEERRLYMSLRWRGEGASTAKLTEAQVREIRASDASSRQWARELNMCPSTIQQLRRGETWKHVV